jgi:hypothetical protein
MPIQKLERNRWQGFFDRVGRAATGSQVRIEVAGVDIGDQIEVEWAPLEGLNYDPKSDVLYVQVEGLEHSIAHPGEIHVDREADDLKSVVVVTEDGRKQFLTMKRPLALPAA